MSFGGAREYEDVTKRRNLRQKKHHTIEQDIFKVFMTKKVIILGLQPIPGDPKDNGGAAMLDDRTFCFVIQHGRHAIVFLDLQGLVANQELTKFSKHTST